MRAGIKSIFEIIRTYRWHFFAWNLITVNCLPENNFDNTPKGYLHNLRFQDFTTKLVPIFLTLILVGKLFSTQTVSSFNWFSKFQEKSAAKTELANRPHSASALTQRAKLRLTQLESSTIALYYSATADLNEIKTKNQKVDFSYIFRFFFSQTQCREKLVKWRRFKKFCHHEIRVQYRFEKFVNWRRFKKFCHHKNWSGVSFTSLWKTCQMTPIQEVLPP